MSPTTYPAEYLVEQALANYVLRDPQVAFIRHSDNLTYKVTTATGEAYLLRIHLPVTAAMGTHGADFDMVNSEMTWLQALGQDTDLVVPRPVGNQAGGLVTRLPLRDGVTIHSTLLSWLDGEPYLREMETRETAYQIGVILATLHKHASQWVIPPGFTRPRRDRAYFKTMLACLEPLVREGRISLADYAELSQSIATLIEMMGGAAGTAEQYGLIHADAHKGNLLYQQGQIRLIDFSFCAFGDYLFDLGICLSDMKKELHSSCLQGYQSLRSLPEDYDRWIEGYFLGSMAGAFAFWAANPAAGELLARKAPEIARDCARKFNQNEHFWF